ncbi:MAG: class I SAM-dependent methyltransferase [Candidatus Korobacteraceae bacterium]
MVRTAEGRGSDSDDYYLALPYRDLSGHNQSQWTIRARTFEYFERRILPPLEASQACPLTILDLGAGNGWMSYRLALRGHRPCAVDLLTNDSDGLAAADHYREQLPDLFPRFQAELDCLPFEDSRFDLAVFNASFHYSEDYVQTLGEAIRCVRPGGSIVIADTAWYRREESGQQMIAERQNAFTHRHGLPSNAIKSQEYLTDQRLASLASACGIRWDVYSPSYGLRWAMRPWIAKLKGKREPSRFRIHVAEVAK